jgi:hypothetical protein
VIKEAQRTNYNEQIATSHNKVNTTWNIIKSATREKVHVDDISLLSKEGDKINNCKVNYESFNIYFNHC